MEKADGAAAIFAAFLSLVTIRLGLVRSPMVKDRAKNNVQVYGGTLVTSSIVTHFVVTHFIDRK